MQYPTLPFPGPRAVTDSGYALVVHQRRRVRAPGATGERGVLVVAVDIESDAEVAVGHAGGPGQALRVGRVPEVTAERTRARRWRRVRRVGRGEAEHDAVGAGAVELIGVERDVETLRWSGRLAW